MMKFLLIVCAVAVLAAAKKCPDNKATKLRAMLCAPEETENFCGSKKEIGDLVDTICLKTKQFNKDFEVTGDFPCSMKCLLKEARVNKTHVDTQKMKSCVESTQSVSLISAFDSILDGVEEIVVNTTGLIGQILENTIGGQ